MFDDPIDSRPFIGTRSQRALPFVWFVQLWQRKYRSERNHLWDLYDQPCHPVSRPSFCPISP